MSRPDGGLITENNLQYYAGAQIIYTSVNSTTNYTFTFNLQIKPRNHHEPLTFAIE